MIQARNPNALLCKNVMKLQESSRLTLATCVIINYWLLFGVYDDVTSQIGDGDETYWQLLNNPSKMIKARKPNAV